MTIEAPPQTCSASGGPLRREHRATDDLLDSPIAVTLLHGRRDEDAPVELVEALGKRLPETAELLVVDGDHHLAVRRPEMVAALLQASVRAH